MDTTAREIMSEKLIVVNDKMTVEDAVKILVNNKITGLPVVDDFGRMVGVLSEYDIIAAVGTEKKITNELFKRQIVYTKEVIAVEDDAPLDVIMDRFIKLKCRRLPVVDKDQKLLGIISRRDIMRLLYYRAKVS
jgi:CBS domain-containing protein